VTAQEKADQEVVAIRLLQLCRAILHNELVLGRDIEQVQNALAQFHIILPVASLLSSTSDEVVRETLAFLIMILHGGNRVAQESFAQHFLQTREETFFVDVSTRLQSAMESIQEVCPTFPA
jgi:hypothetical protein